MKPAAGVGAAAAPKVNPPIGLEGGELPNTGACVLLSIRKTKKYVAINKHKGVKWIK